MGTKRSVLRRNVPVSAVTGWLPGSGVTGRPPLSAITGRLPFGSRPGAALTDGLRQVMLTGAAVTIPFLVTVVVLAFVLNFVGDVLEPFVQLLTVTGLARGVDTPVAQGIVVLGILGFVFAAGVVVESGSGSRIGPVVRSAFEGMPAIGTVYTSFDRMSDVMLRSETPSFQEVKLVEFPHQGTYAIAFLTAAAPESVESATPDGDLQVLFVPMAPNPVMGGHLVCVPTSRVYDVDMSMQEAFQAIVTSGVAVNGSTPGRD